MKTYSPVGSVFSDLPTTYKPSLHDTLQTAGWPTAPVRDDPKRVSTWFNRQLKPLLQLAAKLDGAAMSLAHTPQVGQLPTVNWYDHASIGLYTERLKQARQHTQFDDATATKADQLQQAAERRRAQQVVRWADTSQYLVDHYTAVAQGFSPPPTVSLQPFGNEWQKAHTVTWNWWTQLLSTHGREGALHILQRDYDMFNSIGDSGHYKLEDWYWSGPGHRAARNNISQLLADLTGTWSTLLDQQQARHADKADRIVVAAAPRQLGRLLDLTGPFESATHHNLVLLKLPAALATAVTTASPWANAAVGETIVEDLVAAHPADDHNLLRTALLTVGDHVTNLGRNLTGFTQSLEELRRTVQATRTAVAA